MRKLSHPLFDLRKRKPLNKGSFHNPSPSLFFYCNGRPKAASVTPAAGSPEERKIPFLPQCAPRSRQPACAFRLEGGAGPGKLLPPPGPGPRLPRRPGSANGKVNRARRRGREAKLGVAPDPSPPDNKRPGHRGAAGEDTCPRTGPAPQPAGGAGLGGRHCGGGGGTRARRLGAPSGGSARRDSGSRPAPAPRSGRALAGLGLAAPRPVRSGEGAGAEQGPAARRTPPPEPRSSAPAPGLRLRAGRGAGPDAPWLRGGPGGGPGAASDAPTCSVRRGRGRVAGP